MNEIRGVLVRLLNGKPTATIERCENDVENLQKIIGADIFDIQRRKVKGKFYDFYCDDEYFLREHPEGLFNSVVCKQDREFNLYGNVFITNTDEEGRTVSLLKEECAEVLEAFNGKSIEVSQPWE